MPKIKTHSSAKKRFKVTATGKVVHWGANHSHRLRRKSEKAKGRFLGRHLVDEADERRVKVMLGLQ